MGISYGPSNIVEDGLVFLADAGNTLCYTSGSATCIDLMEGITGTLQDDTMYSPVGNGSWEFDGTDDYIDFGGSSQIGIPGTANITLEMWCRKDTSGDQAIFSAWNAIGYHGIYFQWYTNGRLYFGICNGSNIYNGTDVTWSDSWFHCAGVYDGSLGTDALQGKIYVNGILKTNAENGAIPTTISSTSADIQVGSMQNYAGWSDGKITGVKIYNKSLTATEILQNYNATKGRFAS
jgi:hypothetical protein